MRSSLARYRATIAELTQPSVGPSQIELTQAIADLVELEVFTQAIANDCLDALDAREKLRTVLALYWKSSDPLGEIDVNRARRVRRQLHVIYRTLGIPYPP